MDSLADYLKPLLLGMPNQLVGELTRQQMLATASLLPSIFAFSTMGFECPLHDPSSNADLLVSAQQQRNGATALSVAPLAGCERGEPAWQSVNVLGQVMAEENPRIDDVWLEFDLAGPAPTTPNLFLRPLYAGERFDDIIEALSPLLTGEVLPTDVSDAVRHCVRALPDRAQVFQVGAMRARSFYGLRLCINEISLDGILAFLEASSFPGDIEVVKALLINIQPVVGDVALNLDLAPQLQAKIGFECYFEPGRQQATKEALLNGFLEKLSASGTCVPSKVEALLRYPGESDTSVENGSWPAGIKMATLLSGARRCIFRRSIHHIKLVHQSGQPLQAKAYLAIQQQWRDQF